MAIVELKVPSPGESITEVVIARWVKKTGDVVEKDEVLAEIDSDKATLTLNAEESGKIELARRDTLTKESVERSKVVDIVVGLMTEIQTSMFNAALKRRDDSTSVVNSWEEFEKALEKGWSWYLSPFGYTAASNYKQISKRF